MIYLFDMDYLLTKGTINPEASKILAKVTEEDEAVLIIPNKTLQMSIEVFSLLKDLQISFIECKNVLEFAYLCGKKMEQTEGKVKVYIKGKDFIPAISILEEDRTWKNSSNKRANPSSRKNTPSDRSLDNKISKVKATESVPKNKVMSAEKKSTENSIKAKDSAQANGISILKKNLKGYPDDIYKKMLSIIMRASDKNIGLPTLINVELHDISDDKFVEKMKEAYALIRE